MITKARVFVVLSIAAACVTLLVYFTGLFSFKELTSYVGGMFTRDTQSVVQLDDYVVLPAEQIDGVDVEALSQVPVVTDRVLQMAEDSDKNTEILQKAFFAGGESTQVFDDYPDYREHLIQFRDDYLAGKWVHSFDGPEGRRCLISVDTNRKLWITTEIDVDKNGTPDIEVDALRSVMVSIGPPSSSNPVKLVFWRRVRDKVP